MDERRKTPRVRAGSVSVARLLLLPPANSSAALIEDASPCGLGLATARPLVPESRLGVELPSTDLLAARVAHVAARPDGTWRVGLEITFPAGEDLLGMLGWH
jgi:hypothetical protein